MTEHRRRGAFVLHITGPYSNARARRNVGNITRSGSDQWAASHRAVRDSEAFRGAARDETERIIELFLHASEI